MTMTPEQKTAVDQAGNTPVVMEDRETHESYVIVKEETYRWLAKAIEAESVDPVVLRIRRVRSPFEMK